MSIHVLSGTAMRMIAFMPEDLQRQAGQGSGLPQRYFKQRPEDTGTFILPLKQSFMKDARLMPGTRCMLALLAGWAGQGRALELTEGTIAKHIGRSVRQVYRYLKDAGREGYLRYCYTKNRIGMITGLKIWLSFDLIRSVKTRPADKVSGKFSGKLQGNRRNSDQTLMSDINNNYKYIGKKDAEIEKKLQRLQKLIE